MLAKVYNDLDTKAGSLQVIERFVDVYVPIRMQQQIGETLKAVLPDNLVKKLESPRHFHNGGCHPTKNLKASF